MKWKIVRILEIGLTAVLVIALAMVIRTQVECRQEADAQKEAAMLANLPPQLQRYGQEFRGENEPDPNLALLAQVDLNALQAENPDVVGWICIPDTELSYPLLQGEDNAFYLSHTWQRKRNAGGSVFMAQTCNADFTDYHTIIYAHRMNNGSMFGTLKYYERPDFWQEHPSVYVVTVDSVLRYDIFSAQEAGVRDILYCLDIEGNSLESELLQYCINGSVIDTGLTPKAGDPILTLSTCTERGHDTRWVVHGVLTQTYECSNKIR